MTAMTREIKDGASTRPPGINVGPCGPAAKIIFTWGTFLNEVRMRKLRSSDGVHSMGRPLDAGGSACPVLRPSLRCNQRAPHAQRHPLRHDGTQGTASDMPEGEAARARFRCARKWHMPEAQRKPLKPAPPSSGRAAK